MSYIIYQYYFVFKQNFSFKKHYTKSPYIQTQKADLSAGLCVLYKGYIIPLQKVLRYQQLFRMFEQPEHQKNLQPCLKG